MFYKKFGLPISVFVCVLLFLTACSTAEPAAQAVHWSYEGEEGAENWGGLSSEFALCGSGKEQSPINLTQAAFSDLENIEFHYGQSAIQILNNGHMVQVNYDEGSSATIDGEVYNLVQFHFHAPSEHVVDGKSFPAEMHLVHKNAAGKLAVVGILIAEGKENAAFSPVWENMPAEETEAIDTGASINALDLLPADTLVYRYSGSLTTPPCSEGVLWSVMQSPVEMSAAQIAAYTSIFEGTNRPIQALNERVLILDSTP